jgi:hypothetical protein
MYETKVTLTREETRELWHASCKAVEEARKENRPLTAKDLAELQKKLMDDIINRKSQQEQ